MNKKSEYILITKNHISKTEFKQLHWNIYIVRIHHYDESGIEIERVLRACV